MNIIVMGVAGSGKTTVGRRLAARLGPSWRFLDGDDFHPPANRAKMGRGVPLDDADRGPWLAALRAELDAGAAGSASLVLACSALKEAYRRRLAAPDGDTRWVYLKGDFAVLAARLRLRRGHYMKASMLGSQFAALEEPVAESALVVDAALKPDEIVDRIVAGLSPQRR